MHPCTTPLSEGALTVAVVSDANRAALRPARHRRLRAAGLLAAGALPVFASPALAQQGGFYLGVPAAVERLDVRYDKAVDNTDPRNMSPSRGEVYRASAAATGAAGSVGFLAGYRVPVDRRGVSLSGEVDVVYAGGTVGGRLAGAGFSADRMQLGENWPEDWTVETRRSYGVTVRLGAGVSPGSGLSLSGLAGLRRLDARFGVDYSGCFRVTLCTAAEFVPRTDSYDERFTGWTAGAGVEQQLSGGAALRGEIHYTGYRSTDRVIPYDDLAIQVPITLEASGVRFWASLLWYF